MINNIFAVFDTKAAAYMAPFMMPTIGMAIRQFSDAAQKGDNLMSQHPEDFVLFHLGTFDDATAKFEPNVAPNAVANAIEFANDAEKIFMEGTPTQMDIEDTTKEKTN